MSVYDHRGKSEYGSLSVKRSYCKNPHILKWWTCAHDRLIVKQIEKEQWLWYWGITEEIVRITSSEIIYAWQEEDPLCSQYTWYNVLMYFAASRAQVREFTKKIRKPVWKTCPLCNKRLVQDSLSGPLVRRIGIDHIDFCAPCLSEALFQGSDTLSKEQALSYLRDLTDVLQRVPSQNLGEGVNDLDGLNHQERLALLQVLKRKPTVQLVKKLFGSWLKALIEAEVLEDGTRRTSRGIQCLAKDGHVCLSWAKKPLTIFSPVVGLLMKKNLPILRETSGPIFL